MRRALSVLLATAHGACVQLGAITVRPAVRARAAAPPTMRFADFAVFEAAVRLYVAEIDPAVLNDESGLEP